MAQLGDSQKGEEAQNKGLLEEMRERPLQAVWCIFVGCCSVAQLCTTLRPHRLIAPQASLSLTISQSLLKLMSIESVMPFNHIILCRLLLLLPSIFLSIRVFSSELALRIRWPNYWSFSFSISPSSEYPGLISFWIEWFDLLAVQGILMSLLQHHNLKASILYTQSSLWSNSHIQTSS